MNIFYGSKHTYYRYFSSMIIPFLQRASPHRPFFVIKPTFSLSPAPVKYFPSWVTRFLVRKRKKSSAFIKTGLKKSALESHDVLNFFWVIITNPPRWSGLPGLMMPWGDKRSVLGFRLFCLEVPSLPTLMFYICIIRSENRKDIDKISTSLFTTQFSSRKSSLSRVK